ncbi:MAG: glycerophosphodiester phosphodiesterase [Saprospirales bacterium]|jgi:glycerophosphoryl diester phosphodiesterase|nr:glycerophosphodiester phosphodiesterase [Saprospirales bacterium]MBK8923157.1 glycerophosphodiester phosphodiesterase [Saprospirales bacterium]
MFSSLSFLFCKFTERKPVRIPEGFDWQGHRGCRGLRPENSLPAFIHALEFPEVGTLELDLAVSKDRQLIVSHEPWFNPDICQKTTGDSLSSREAEVLFLYQMTVEEIRSFDCGSRRNPKFKQQQPIPVHKPTLREVVEAVRNQYPGKVVRWNLEIKSEPAWDGIRTPQVDDFVQLVVDELRALQLEEQHVTVQSFDVRPLQVLRQLRPQLRLALLVANARGLESNLRLLGFTPAIYSPYYLLVDRSLVRRCQAQGIKVIPWTVNEVPAMRRLVRLGVDGIITDYPDKIAGVSRQE